MTDSAHLLFKPAVWLTDKLRVDRSAVTALAEGRRDQRPLHYFSWKKLFNVIRVEAQLRTRRAKAWGGLRVGERYSQILSVEVPLVPRRIEDQSPEQGEHALRRYDRHHRPDEGLLRRPTPFSRGESFLNRRIYLSVAYPHENSTATIVSRNLNKLMRQETAEQWLPREQPEPAYAGSTGMMGQGRRGISSTDGRRFPLATGRMDESDEE